MNPYYMNILGAPIIVTFDQEIDTSSVNDSTFSLTWPGTSRHNLVSPSCRHPGPSRAPAAAPMISAGRQLSLNGVSLLRGKSINGKIIEVRTSPAQ
jgi:hypothetical protein